MNQNNTYDKIEAYLLNQMSAGEKRNFEAELADNEQLASQFQEQEREHRLMEAVVEKKLLQDLKKWQAEDDETESGDSSATPEKEPKVIPFYRRRFLLAIAATISFLVVAMLWIVDKKEPDMLALATSFDRSVDGYRSGAEDNSARTEALNLISQKEYDQCITNLKQRAEIEKDNPDIPFFIGIAYQKNNKFREAIPYLQQATFNKDYGFSGRAQYLLSLCYLGSGDKVKAVDLLKEIAANPDYPDYKIAAELLSQLK